MFEKLQDFVLKYKWQLVALVVLLAGFAWANSSGGCTPQELDTATTTTTTNVGAESSNTTTTNTTGETTEENTTGTTTTTNSTDNTTGTTTGTNNNATEGGTNNTNDTTGKSVNDVAPSKVPATTNDGTPTKDKTSNKIDCDKVNDGTKPAGYPKDLSTFGC
jgi:cytoskeletal protein RodZ